MGLLSRLRHVPYTVDVAPELLADVRNPGRGWYRIAPYDLHLPFGDESFVMWGDEGDSLVLARVCIGAYRDRDLDAEALDRLHTILSTWEAADRQVIFRVAYDVVGAGYDAEPFELAQVVSHAHQVGKVMAEHPGAVFVYQGLLVGSWAEMHHSRYLSSRRMRAIYQALRDEVGRDVPLLIRTPRQVKQILGNARLGDSGVMGIFNDGMMGSETDLSTFGTTTAGETLPATVWARRVELEALGRYGDIAPLGGEAVGTTSFSVPEAAQSYLRACRVTYLNRTHDSATLERWREAKGPDRWPSAYDYIGAHLGYRLVCKRVRILPSGDELTVEADVANTGFARPFFVLDACFESEGALVGCSGLPDVWESGKTHTLAARLPADAGDHIWLRFVRRPDGHPVRLAHETRTDVLPIARRTG